MVAVQKVTLNSLTQDNNFNKNLYRIILDHLKIMNIDIEKDHDLFIDLCSFYGCSYLSHNIVMLWYPKLTWYKTLITHNEISNTINCDFYSLTDEQQILIFNTFASLHEIGHAIWGQKLSRKYTQRFNKKINEKRMLLYKY